MPPKAKKPKAKPKAKPKPKAKAKAEPTPQSVKTKTKTNIASSSAVVTGKGQAQVINVYTGRSRAPTKAKAGEVPQGPSAGPGPDGWYPTQNLMRNGSTFASYYPPYQPLPPAPSNFMIAPPPPAPSFMQRAGSQFPMLEDSQMQSGLDASFAPEEESVPPEPPVTERSVVLRPQVGQAPSVPAPLVASRGPDLMQELQRAALARSSRVGETDVVIPSRPVKPSDFTNQIVSLATARQQRVEERGEIPEVAPKPKKISEFQQAITAEKEKREKQKQKEYLVEESTPETTFAPPTEAPTTFEEIAQGEPIAKHKAPKVTPPREIKEAKASILDEVKELIRGTGTPQTGKKKTSLLQQVFGDKYKPGQQLEKYSYDELASARQVLKSQNEFL